MSQKKALKAVKYLTLRKVKLKSKENMCNGGGYLGNSVRETSK